MKRKGLLRAEPATNVMVGIPCGDMIHTDCATSLCDMMAYIQGNPPPGLEQLAMQFARSSILPHSRMALVERAFKLSATHLLMIDSDMSFPPDTLHRLLSWRKEFVASAALIRRKPFCSNAEVKPNEKLVTTPDSTGIEKVHSVGTALVLIETQVFERIELPWFDFVYRSKTEFVGEDIYLCTKLREAGVELHVDQGLSRDVKHVGIFAYGVTDAGRFD